MSKDDIKLSPKHGLNPTMPVCFWCGKEKNEVAHILINKVEYDPNSNTLELYYN